MKIIKKIVVAVTLLISMGVFADDFNYTTTSACQNAMQKYNNKAVNYYMKAKNDTDRQGWLYMSSFFNYLVVSGGSVHYPCDQGQICKSEYKINCGMLVASETDPSWKEKIKTIFSEEVNANLLNGLYDNNFTKDKYIISFVCNYPYGTDIDFSKCTLVFPSN